MSRLPMHAVLLVVTGVIVAGGAYSGVSMLEATFLGLEWQLYQAAAGAAFSALGMVGMMAAMLKRPDPRPSVEAHVAFLSKPRPTAGSIVPDPPALGPAPARKSAAGAGDLEMESVEAEIREVTRQINKAGVLLGTGKLSREGYTEYVAELKAKRGALEAERVRLELERQRQRFA